jgi:dihydroorotase
MAAGLVSWLAFGAGPRSGGAQSPRFDLLIKGGHVVDPQNGIDQVMDIALAGGRIARVAPEIAAVDARRVLDVRGLFVTPGLIDLHAHHYGYSGSIFPDDAQLAAGVTTSVDCGGAGWRTFEDFKARIVDHAATRILAFINIVGHGMVAAYENDVSDMDPVATAAMMRKYPGLIVGIKTAHFSLPGWAAVERAVEAGRLSGKPVIIDNNILSWTGRDTRTKVLEKMRPGDIHTHMYNDRHLEVVDRRTRQLTPFILEARKRGVLFDLGHGSGSFLWPVADAAMRQGFAPDTLSSDLHASSIMGPESDLANCVSKMLLLGMKLPDAIRRATARPAEILGRSSELGSLAEGRAADVAVFELRRGIFAYKDALQMKRLGTEKLVAVLTLRDGRVVYDLNGIAFPEWKDAGRYERMVDQ